MVAAQRALILDDILETLEGVAEDLTSRSTPCKVERVLRTWNDPGLERPWLGFAPGKTIFEHKPFGFIECRMPVDIVGHIASEDDNDRAEFVAALQDDVLKALEVDTTRGRNAITTTIKDEVSNEGSPDTQSHDGGSGSFAMVVEVFYIRTTGKS